MIVIQTLFLGIVFIAGGITEEVICQVTQNPLCKDKRKKFFMVLDTKKSCVSSRKFAFNILDIMTFRDGLQC